MLFDSNGNMTQVQPGASSLRKFVADSSGLIYQKQAGTYTSYYAYAGGHGIASFSTDPNEQDDFDFNYTAISDQYPASAPGRYVAQAGDTLRKVALTVWGDANLWYLIADANGLSIGGSAALVEGTSLIIPSQAVNLANRSDTFKPYNESAIHGDLTPSLPPPKKKCGALLAAIVVVVSVAVSVWFPPAIGIAANSLPGAMLAAAAGAAAGSVAGQMTGMALGIQDAFSWSAVGKSALSAALTAGLTRGLGGGLGLDKIEGGIGKFSYAGMAQGALNSVVGQGVGIALKQQEKFSWASMAASSLVKGVSGKTGIGWLDRAADEMEAGTADFGQQFGFGFSTGLANRTIQVALEGRGKVDVLNIAADAFGNALGSELVRMGQSVQDSIQFSPGLGEDWDPQVVSESIPQEGRFNDQAIQNAADDLAWREDIEMLDWLDSERGQLERTMAEVRAVSDSARRKQGPTARQASKPLADSDAIAAASKEATFEHFFGPSDTEPAWSFKEASMALRQQQDAQAAQRHQVSLTGGAEMRAYDPRAVSIFAPGGFLGEGGGLDAVRGGPLGSLYFLAGAATGANLDTLNEFSLLGGIADGMALGGGGKTARASPVRGPKVPRLGPNGVDPLHHNANVLVRDASGNIVAHERLVSGNMTPAEQALGFPKNTLASHTEARAVRNMELEPGGSMTITGQNAPCPSCKGAMNRAAAESGATIKYQWRQDGKTLTWTAKPKNQ